MNNYVTAILITAAIGIVNTIYLSWCCITKRDVKCLFLPPKQCLKVQYSKYSRTMGIPNPYLGLAMLLAIIILTFLFIEAILPFWTIFAIVSAGVLFSFYFLFIQAFILKAFCTWCVLSAIVFTVLFVLSLLQMILLHPNQI
ncbi:MAG: vitamin K epoxide reductase family protein [Flavobacteriales bacterium]|nr:vitamin K epoxide reductase family protein [Flavobacteriales bacterium]